MSDGAQLACDRALMLDLERAHEDLKRVHALRGDKLRNLRRNLRELQRAYDRTHALWRNNVGATMRWQERHGVDTRQLARELTEAKAAAILPRLARPRVAFVSTLVGFAAGVIAMLLLGAHGPQWRG